MLTNNELDSFNEERDVRLNVEALVQLGGKSGLLRGLKTDPIRGLSCSEAEIERRRSSHGSNKMPEPEPQTWFEMFIESFYDTTVIILMVSAVVSLVVGIYEDPSKGWIEGTTILIAVVIVAAVTATNNFNKEAQFRELNSVKDKIEVTVIRNGSIQQISTHDIVVGDMVQLSSGDKVPSDGVVITTKTADGLYCNESAYTGESEDKRKNCLSDIYESMMDDDYSFDPFLACGTTIASGACHMVVTAVGSNSRWGKTKAILPSEIAPTPLQEKLDILANQIGNGGMLSAGATFVAMLTIWYLYPASRVGNESLFEYMLRAFIMAVTIVVVAVPEGLPLAVTVSLAYSTGKMMDDNNLIRVLDACETMGNATCICSDKTGTLTQNQMTVKCGYIGGVPFYDELPTAEELTSDVLALIAESLSVNSSVNILNIDSSATSATKPMTIVGSRTESAMLLMLYNIYGINYNKLRDNGFVVTNGDQLYSFTSARKRMTTLQMPNTEVTVDNSLMITGASLSSAAPQTPTRSTRKKVATTGKKRAPVANSATVYVKGAAETVLDLCTEENVACKDAQCAHESVTTTNHGLLTIPTTPLTEESRRDILDFISTCAKKSLRCIAVAHRTLTLSQLKTMSNREDDGYDVTQLERNMTLDAIYCIADPLRPDVTEAIRVCHDAGIVVRMVTGDNVETAEAIATECGILTKGGTVMDGPTFRNLTPAQLDEHLPHLCVLARSSPSDKFNLVARLNGNNLPSNQEEWEAMHPGCDYDSLKDVLLPGYRSEWEASRDRVGNDLKREVVGVTGDGTNDAPALRVADVGLSMGLCGTEAAKEASDIVILDDNFSSIVKAVLWGRSVYDNIRKFLQFQLTVNIVALLITFASAVYGFEPPLNAVMMLWVNLIMDTMGALALGTETPSKELLNRSPYKRDASLISTVLWRNILIQSAFQLSLLGYLLMYGVQDFLSAHTAIGSVHHLTFIFNTFVFCQVFNEFNARNINDDMNVFKGLFNNIVFLSIIIFTVIAQYLIVEYGGEFVKVTPLSGSEWYSSVLLAALTLPIGGLMRMFPISENIDDYAPLSKLIKKTHTKSKKHTSEHMNISYFIWVVLCSLIIAASYHEFYVPFWAPRLTIALEMLFK